MVRALASHQCGPGSIPARCHTRVEFAVGSHLTPSFFLRAPLRKTEKNVFYVFNFSAEKRFLFGLSFLPPQKPRTRMASSLNIVIYLFILSIYVLGFFICFNKNRLVSSHTTDEPSLCVKHSKDLRWFFRIKYRNVFLVSYTLLFFFFFQDKKIIP